MKKFVKLLALILIVSLISISFAGCKKDNKPTKDNTENLEALGMTNIDGTPIEVEPYETETGEPYVNEDGYPVYQVRNTYDENGDPVLVIKTLNVDEDGKIIFKLQKIENGKIVDAYDEEDPQGTTTFLGNPDAIPSADGKADNNGNNQSGNNDNGGSGDNGNNQATTKGNDDNDSGNGSGNGNSSSGSSKDDNKTVNGDEILTDDLIKLGGVWGNVKKTERDNVYRGNLVEAKLTKLKEEKTYAGINATFDKGVYIPETIKAEDGTVYNVRQVAYTRLYVYYDTWEDNYDWFTERGIFKPGRDDDPLVYIEDNDTFELDAEYKSIHTTFLIELAKA